MSSERITEFFATLGFQINKKDLAQVDKTLGLVEARMREFITRYDQTFTKVQRGVAAVQRAAKAEQDIRWKKERADAAAKRTAQQEEKLNQERERTNRESKKTLQQQEKVNQELAHTAGVKKREALKESTAAERVKAAAARTRAAVIKEKEAMLDSINKGRMALARVKNEELKGLNSAKLTAAKERTEAARRVQVEQRTEINNQKHENDEIRKTITLVDKLKRAWTQVGSKIKVDEARVEAFGRSTRGAASSTARMGRPESGHHGKLHHGIVGMMNQYAFPLFMAGYGFKALNDVNQQLVGQQNAATAVFGSRKVGQQNLSWLRQQGNEIGFDYRDQANPYLQMMASARESHMADDKTRYLFSGLMQYGRTLGLSNDQLKSSSLALEQMLSKGTIQAQEAKLQLGNSMPGAMQLLAQAATGGDMAKLMKEMTAGQLKSTDILPKLAKIFHERALKGGALTSAEKSSQAEQGRLSNAFSDFVKAFSKGGLEQGQATIFKQLAIFLERITKDAPTFGKMWVHIADVIKPVLNLIADLTDLIPQLIDSLHLSKPALAIFGAALFALLVPGGELILAFGAILLVLEDITGFMDGRKSLIGQFLAHDPQAANRVRKYLLSLKHLIHSVGELVNNVVTDFGKLFKLFSDHKNGFLITFLDKLNSTVTELNNVIDKLNALLNPDSKKSFTQRIEDVGKSYGHFVYNHVVTHGITSALPRYLYHKLFGSDEISKMVNDPYSTDFGFQNNSTPWSMQAHPTQNHYQVSPSFYITSDNGDDVVKKVDKYMQAMFKQSIQDHTSPEQ